MIGISGLSIQPVRMHRQFSFHWFFAVFFLKDKRFANFLRGAFLHDAETDLLNKLVNALPGVSRCYTICVYYMYTINYYI